VSWRQHAAIVMLAAGVGWAQAGANGDTPADPAASVRLIAERRVAEWEALAKALDAKTARMLPCDPQAKEAVAQVSRASEARLAAIGDMLKAALTQTKADIERVRLALTAEDLSLHEAESERTDSEQARTAIDGQLGELTESANHHEGLEDARKKLADIMELAARRTNIAAEQLQVRANLDISLRDLQVALQAKQTALQNELAALLAEGSRWGEYYAARLNRTQTECTITKSPQRKKRP
jgi:hypothetical protein